MKWHWISGNMYFSEDTAVGYPHSICILRTEYPKTSFSSTLQLDVHNFYVLDGLYYFRWWNLLGSFTYRSIGPNDNCPVFSQHLLDFSLFSSFYLFFLLPSWLSVGQKSLNIFIWPISLNFTQTFWWWWQALCSMSQNVLPRT